jgi:hypothetical protein
MKYRGVVAALGAIRELLEEEHLVDTVYKAQGERHHTAASVTGCKRRRK